MGDDATCGFELQAVTLAVVHREGDHLEPGAPSPCRGGRGVEPT